MHAGGGMVGSSDGEDLDSLYHGLNYCLTTTSPQEEDTIMEEVATDETRITSPESL